MSKHQKSAPARTGIISGLARLTGRAEPSPLPRDNLGYPVPPSRQGRRGLTSHHDPAVIQQLKELALERRTTQQTLLEEALNMLFVKYGRPDIA
jgi:hypothetical protein